MDILNNIKKGLLQGIGFLLMLGLGGIVYATFTTINEVSSTDILTASTFNELVNNQKDLDSRIVSSSGLGVGQNWIDLSGTRVIGDTYTNNEIKPISVYFHFRNRTASTTHAEIYVDGLNVDRVRGSGDTYSYGISAIIPAGSTYRITISGANDLNKWHELR